MKRQIQGSYYNRGIAMFTALISGCIFAVAQPTLPSIPAGTFNITSYGASTSSANNAAAIQAAINAAGAAGGGTVTMPSGVFLSGPIVLTNHLCFNVPSGTTLRMLPYGTYPSSIEFIDIDGLNNVKINGYGTIDGQGAAWWAAYNANNSVARPGVISGNGTTIGQVSEVTITNAPNVNISFHYTCNDITINNITVSAPSTSPNTDGIDLEGSNFLINSCNISDGDDNIAIVGEHNAGDYITVENCTFGAGHGCSIGSYTADGVSFVGVTNCTFNGTSDGIRMKSEEGRGGTVQYISYSGLTMNNVSTPIWIYSLYPDNPPPSDPATVASGTPDSTTPIWKHITINDVTATGASNAGWIYGLPYEDVGTMTITDLNITATTGLDIYFAGPITFSGSSVKVSSGNSVTVYDATVTGIGTTEY